MAKTPFWQLVQNNRLLQPFQVRDVSGKTLLDRAKWLVLFTFLSLLIIALLSNHQVNLLLNRDELEQVESEFVAQFYPAYDSIYYWLAYQGNLTQEVTRVADERAAERFLDSLETNLASVENLKSIQFGQVGVTGQWLARLDEAGEWQLMSEVNQDFAAWLLTQELESDQIYWYGGRQEESQEISLFWLHVDEEAQKTYFLATIDFPYRLEISGTHRSDKRLGAAVFVGESVGQQFYPLRTGEQSASQTAELAPEFERAGMAFALGGSDGQMLEQITRHSLQGGSEIFELKIGEESFWAKTLPVVTHTDYQWLVIVLQQVEPLSQWGVSASLIRWLLAGYIGFNVFLFFFNYWRYSRRYYFTNQIKDLIKNGENARLEFKSTLRYDLREKQLNKNLENAILKSIAAFNNTDGGLLIIGVSDDAKVLGLKNDYGTLKKQDKDGFELHLRALVSQAYGQHFAARRLEIFFPTLENKEICVVNVKKGRSALYTDTTDKNGVKQEKFYIRMGNSSREIEKLSDIVDYQNQRFKLRLPKWGKK